MNCASPPDLAGTPRVINLIEPGAATDPASGITDRWMRTRASWSRFLVLMALVAIAVIAGSAAA